MSANLRLGGATTPGCVSPCGSASNALVVARCSSSGECLRFTRPSGMRQNLVPATSDATVPSITTIGVSHGNFARHTGHARQTPNRASCRFGPAPPPRGCALRVQPWQCHRVWGGRRGLCVATDLPSLDRNPLAFVWSCTSPATLCIVCKAMLHPTMWPHSHVTGTARMLCTQGPCDRNGALSKQSRRNSIQGVAARGRWPLESR